LAFRRESQRIKSMKKVRIVSQSQDGIPVYELGGEVGAEMDTC
jgi:hypothetical protein